MKRRCLCLWTALTFCVCSYAEIPTNTFLNQTITSNINCDFALKQKSYRNLMLIGPDATQAYHAYQLAMDPEMKAEIPIQSPNAGVQVFGYEFKNILLYRERRGDTESHYVDFRLAGRQDIDRFLMLFERLPEGVQKALHGNALFDIYKVAGLMFDGPEGEALAKALFRSHNKQPFLVGLSTQWPWSSVEPYSNVFAIGPITLTVIEMPNAEIEFEVSLIDASPRAAQRFIDGMIDSDSDLLNGTPALPAAFFERTRQFGLPMLQGPRNARLED